MGLSEREYMQEPNDPGLSNFAWGLICLFGVAAFFMFRPVSHPRIDISKLNQQVEKRLIEIDPTHNRRDRLSEISPLDINSAPYSQLRLLPRMSEPSRME